MARKTNTNTNTARERSAPKPAKVSAKLQRENEKAAALKAMRPLARTINAKLKSVATMEGKVDDARLAACVAIAQAYALAGKGHIKFKAWCDENVTALGYESLRKMRPIGEAEIAETGAGLAMLQAARSKNASANRKHRAGKSESGGGEGGEGSRDTTGTRPIDMAAAIREMFLKLDDDARIEFLAWAESVAMEETDEAA